MGKLTAVANASTKKHATSNVKIGIPFLKFQ